MRVLTSGIMVGAKIWLLILAVAIASLALAPGSRPADADDATLVHFAFSLTNPVPQTNIVYDIGGEPKVIYVWVENPKGVGAYDIDIQYDPKSVTLTTAERGADCVDALDNDGDGFINDGCPQVGGAPEIDQCYNIVDDDGDGFINDGCPLLAPPAEPIELCWDGLDNEANRDGAPDDGCPVDLELGAECLNSTDDDGDTVVNDGCPTDAAPETGTQCADAVDSDSDLWVNDGCPPDGPETACAEVPGSAVDDDNDGTINDGCPAVGPGEDELIGTQCGNDLDDDGDGFVNDGCPETSSSEAGGQCLDAVDNDGDGLVNDGCPAQGAPEFACSDALDDDSDGLVNDGCPIFGSAESAFQCAFGDTVDDDNDGWVNDGCPQRGPVIVGNETWLGSTGRSAACLDTYTREIAGTDLWQLNLGCRSFGTAPGVQVSGLLASFSMLPGSQFGSAPFTFTVSTRLVTPSGTLMTMNAISALTQVSRCGSVDGDDVVSFLDFLVMLQHFNEVEGVSPGWQKAIDLDDDGAITFLDFLLMLGWFNKQCTPWT